MARPKRAMKHRTSEEVPFSAGLQAGVIPMLPVAPRAKASAVETDAGVSSWRVEAILPCDHHYSDEQTFTAALDSAFDIAAQRTGSVVLLGAHPQGPEVEYGWIELGPSTGGDSFHVRGFCEKPAVHVARELLERGSLWNTFVMVGRVRSFLEMVNAALAGLVEVFRKSHVWTGAEVHIEDSLYERIHSVDFSREVLSLQTRRLGHTGWNDLGHPERVIAVLQAAGLEPWWMKEWQAPRRPPAVAAPLAKPAAVA
jgi:mannose-1-phosphate guanylyltransferase